MPHRFFSEKRPELGKNGEAFSIASLFGGEQQFLPGKQSFYAELKLQVSESFWKNVRQATIWGAFYVVLDQNESEMKKGGRKRGQKLITTTFQYQYLC